MKMPLNRSVCWLTPVVIAVLFGCAGVSVPQWQMNARSSVDRATQAWLEGNQRIEKAEFERARAEISSSARLDLLARMELVRCAAQVAALDLQPCLSFDSLARDAEPADRAYARYLAGQATAEDAAQLPPAQRSVALSAVPALAVQQVEDPLARLVAAGVLFRQAKASPAVISSAVDTASNQGWRRPLLAWLKVQKAQAKAAGDEGEVLRLDRRITHLLSSR